uniref:Deoxyribonuclease-1 n=1 Tax=Sus scrofa TaxID=9823 RepID=A0A8D0ZR83_PIG
MPAAHLLGKPHRRRYVLRSPGDALGRSQLLKPLKPQVGPTFSVGIWSCCSSQLLPFVDFFFKQQKEKIDTEEYQFLILGRIPVFVEVTFQILSRYDIALIQEVRDSHLTAVGKLLNELNQDDPNNYHHVVSEPLGRSTYKERYLFVFRPDQVSVLDSYLYDDGCEPCGNDTFNREPSVVKFSSPFTQVKEFAIVPLHAAPSDAAAEIDSLYDVYLNVRQKWDLEDIMLMGDFNAGCSYVTTSHWSSIRLRESPPFQWLIPDTADTTVSSTHCAYDRIVVAGPLLQRAVVPDSAAPFDFQAAFGLSEQTTGEKTEKR